MTLSRLLSHCAVCAVSVRDAVSLAVALCAALAVAVRDLGSLAVALCSLCWSPCVTLSRLLSHCTLRLLVAVRDAVSFAATLYVAACCRRA